MLKSGAQTLLKKDLEAISRDYGYGLNDKINELGDWSKIFSKDIIAVRQQLIGNDLCKIYKR